MVYTSRTPWNPERIHALAIYCSDGRWGNAFDEFCQEGLLIPRYDRFAVPGGPAWLTLRHITLLTPYSAARDQIDFLVRVHELQRVIIVAHEGCAFYSHTLSLAPEAALQAQLEDLDNAAGTLRAWFAGIQVEAYFANRGDDCPTFDRIEV